MRSRVVSTATSLQTFLAPTPYEPRPYELVPLSTLQAHACYAIAAVAYGMLKNWLLVIVYSGYARANVGLLWLGELMNRH